MYILSTPISVHACAFVCHCFLPFCLVLMCVPHVWGGHWVGVGSEVRTGLAAKQLHKVHLALVQGAQDRLVAGAARALQTRIVKHAHCSGGAVRTGQVA
jgi:hypothetical protein